VYYVHKKQSALCQHSRTERMLSTQENRVNYVYRGESVNYVYTGEQSVICLHRTTQWFMSIQ